jgi:hypothetical protein
MNSQILANNSQNIGIGFKLIREKGWANFTHVLKSKFQQASYIFNIRRSSFVSRFLISFHSLLQSKILQPNVALLFLIILMAVNKNYVYIYIEIERERNRQTDIQCKCDWLLFRLFLTNKIIYQMYYKTPTWNVMDYNRSIATSIKCCGRL